MATEIDGEGLRAAREAAGLTQHELARRIGVAGGERISRWERGDSQPRLDSLRRLAAVLDIPLAMLVSVHGDVPDLRALRLRAGLSVGEVVEHANLTKPTYVRWESGAWSGLPPQPTIEALAQVMGTSSDAVTLALRQAQHDRLAGA